LLVLIFFYKNSNKASCPLRVAGEIKRKIWRGRFDKSSNHPDGKALAQGLTDPARGFES